MKKQAGARKRTCYYKTLGISVRASQADIRSAFRYLAMKLHPDRNPGNPWLLSGSGRSAKPMKR